MAKLYTIYKTLNGYLIWTGSDEYKSELHRASVAYTIADLGTVLVELETVRWSKAEGQKEHKDE